MEAVPRLPMLSFELKHSPEPVEFSTTLKQIIREQYNEDPANYNKACLELEQLRQNAVQVTHDFIGCSTLKKYYAQLQFVQSRFQLQEGGEPPLIFTWEDVQSGREYSHSDVKFEQASILYNIGALHSILGAMDTRQSAEGMKVSCTHFQCSAWAFQFLRDHFGSSSMSPDMAHEILSFHIDLMLAQAQECILEKSMSDNRKSSITAKVAVQIVEFYRQAARNLETTNAEGLISSRRYKDWKRRIEIKILFYQTIMFFYLGSQAEEQEKHGERLAYFTASNDKLAQCAKLAKNDSPDVADSLRFTQDVVGGKYNSAKKDNDFVYHEKVPGIDTLPEIKGASLVKGIPFNPNDPEVSGPDIFHKLVPMEAHESSSLYSEEKAKLLRLIGGEVDGKDEELNQFLLSMQLDVNKLKSEPERLPQSLLEKCAAISVRPNAVKDLVDVMGALSGIATEVELGIQELKQALDEEEKQREEFQKTFGKKSDTIILPEIRKECDICKEQHTRGSQSNAELHKAMNTHTVNLKLISGPLDELQRSLPSTEVVRGPEDEAVVNDLQRIMGKVDEMKSQRATLHEQFRNDVHKDDITNTIVTHEGTDTKTLFQEQLQKHDKVVGLLRQNMSAQKNILSALTDANAKYANIRRATTESSALREAKIKELIISYDVYEDLMAKSQKGLDFYKKLESNVSRLLQRAKGIIKTNMEEREQISKRFAPKGAAPSRPAAPKPSPSSTPPPAPTSQSALPSFDGPKLKDYLPFMKPATFGPKKDRTPPPDMVSQLPAAYPTLPSGIPDLAQMPRFSDMPDGSVMPRGSPQPGYPSDLGGVEARPSPTGSPSLSHHSHTPGQALAAESIPGQTQPLTGLPVGYSFVDDHGNAVQLPASPLPQQKQQPLTNPRVRAKYDNTNTVSSVDTPIISPTKDNMNGHLVHTHNIRHPLGLRPQDVPDVHQQYLQNVEGISQIPGQPPVTYQHPRPRFPPPGSQGPIRPNIPASTQNFTNPQQGYSARYPRGTQPGGPGSSGLMAAATTTATFQPYRYRGQVPTSAVSQGTIPQAYNVNNVPQVQPGYQPPASQSATQLPSLQSEQPGVVPQPLPPGGVPAPQNLGHMVYPQQQIGHTAPQARAPASGFPPQPYIQGSQPYSQQHSMPPNVPQSSIAYQQPPLTSIPSTTAYPNQMNQPAQPVVPNSQGLQQYPVASQQLPASKFQPQTFTSQMPQTMATSAQQQSTAQYWQQQNQVKPVASQSHTGIPGMPQNLTQPSLQPGQQPYLPGQQQTYLQQGQPVAQPGQQQILAQQQQQQYQQPMLQAGQKQPIPQQPQLQTLPQQPLQQIIPQQGHQQAILAQRQPQVMVPPAQQPVAHQGQQQQFTHPGQQALAPQGQHLTGPQQRPNLPVAQLGQQQPFVQQMRPVQQHVSQQQHKSQQTFPQQPDLQGISQRGSAFGVQPASIAPPQVPLQSHTSQGQQPSQLISGQTQHQNLPVQGSTAIQQPVGVQFQGSQKPFIPGQASLQSAASMAQPQQAPLGQPRPTTAGQQPVTSQLQHFPMTQSHQVASLGQPVPPRMGQPQQSSISQPQQQFAGQYQQQLPSMCQPQQPVMGQPQVGIGQQPPITQQLPMGQQQLGMGQQPPQLAAQPGQPSMAVPGQPQTGRAWSGQPGQFSVGHYAGSQPQQAGQRQQSIIGQQLLNQPLQPISTQQPILQPTLQQPIVPQTTTKSTTVPSSSTAAPEAQVEPLPTSAAPPAQGIPNLDQSTTPGSPQKRLLSQRAASLPQPVSQAAQGLSRQLSSSTTSSLDDILSSSPEALRETAAAPDTVLTPKILTAQELQQQKEEAMKLHDLQLQPKDPFTVKETLDKFVVEVERFEKVVENLCKPRLSGTSHLIAEWKELAEEQEKISRQHSIAVARCYVIKNRDPDIMPYDETRVLLKSGKDDYINASWMDDLAPSCPKFIASQGPLPLTLVDFWLMVYEQGTEVIVMLSKEDEPGKKTPVYWPTEKGQVIQHGPITLNLQSVKDKQLWMERIIYLTHTETKQGRTIVHLQYTGWPVSGLPEKIPFILQFINEVQYFYKQQRSLLKPVIVHCSNGVGRTGTFITVYTGMQEINKAAGIIDLPTLITKMRSKRKHMITDMEHLKFCYEAILYHAQDVLMKRGILTNKKSFTDKLPSPGEKTHTRKPSEDFILGTGVGLHALETNVAKFSVKHTVHSTSHDTTATTTVVQSSKVNVVAGQTVIPNVESGETILPSDIIQDPPTSQILPDLVQQQPTPSQNLRVSEVQANVDMLSELGGQTMRQDVNRVRSGSEDRANPTNCSVAPGTQSLGGSPQHRPRRLQDQFSSLPPSLVDLQDPHTFTLDAPSGRKRITKASFTQKKSTMSDHSEDPNDPLSNLDPLWTIHKGNKADSVS